MAFAKGHEGIAREFVIHGFDILGQEIVGADELQRIIPQALKEAVEANAVPMELQKMVLSYLSPTVWRSAEER